MFKYWTSFLLPLHLLLTWTHITVYIDLISSQESMTQWTILRAGERGWGWDLGFFLSYPHWKSFTVSPTFLEPWIPGNVSAFQWPLAPECRWLVPQILTDWTFFPSQIREQCRSEAAWKMLLPPDKWDGGNIICTGALLSGTPAPSASPR